MNRRAFGLAAGQALAAPMLMAAKPITPGLERFHRALGELVKGKRRRVDVLYIGDSHVAGDFMSATLRQGLQARYGNAGRGLVQVPAYPYFRLAGAAAMLNGTWQVFNSRVDAFAGYGITGVAARAVGSLPSANFSSATASHMDVHLLAGPDGGLAVLQGESIATRIDTRGAAGLLIAGGAFGAGNLGLAGDGSLTVLGAEFGNDVAGIRVSSLGIPGATALVAEKWNAMLVAAQIKRLEPQLIIWAFGVNEGFHDDLETGTYADGVAGIWSRLAALAPGADLVIAGPSDAQRSLGPGIECSREWILPPALREVRERLRQMAERRGLAFWDWERAMGGTCAMLKWVEAGLGRKDHVHFSEDGYTRLGEMLLAFLLPKA